MGFDIDIRKQLGNAQVALRVQTGPGITVLLGPSGAGKTSVLNMVYRRNDGTIGWVEPPK